MKSRKLPLTLLAFAVLVAALFFASRVVAQAGTPPATPDTANLVPPIVSAHYRLGWSVQAGGAGKMNSASFRLNATIGQPVIGSTSSTHYKLHAGFWQWFYRYIYLPLLIK